MHRRDESVRLRHSGRVRTRLTQFSSFNITTSNSVDSCVPWGIKVGRIDGFEAAYGLETDPAVFINQTAGYVSSDQLFKKS